MPEKLVPKNVLEVNYILTLTVIGLGFVTYNAFVRPQVSRLVGGL